jgi:hypothetical protein
MWWVESALVWVRGIPPKRSLDGAPIFVMGGGRVGLGSCYPTLAKLGWGTHSLVVGEGDEKQLRGGVFVRA